VEFYVGLHQPSDAKHFVRACISTKRLRARKSHIGACRVMVDSGGFTEVTQHGGYRHNVEVYAIEIERLRKICYIDCVVAQDYMCEPFALGKTGLTVAEHQRLTVERYADLRSLVPEDIHVMPVIQGYAPEEYASHVRMYGDLLKHGMWVGVGSVCKRQGRPEAILAVLRAINAVRPDLRLHGFGVKLTALRVREIVELLHTADSMSWSYHARKNGRSANDRGEAAMFASKVRSLTESHAIAHMQHSYPASGRSYGAPANLLPVQRESPARKHDQFDLSTCWDCDAG
jgi:hypothetical protein